jgi:flagellar biosynthesis protein FlhG
MAAVLGAIRGLGVTTLTARLGRGLVEQGSRVVLIDADVRASELARVCKVADVPASFDPEVVRRDIHEALFPAPGGLLLVPGVWGSAAPTSKTLQQLMRQFQQLGRHAEWLLLDLGTPHPEVFRGWSEALSEVLVVSTPASPSVMDSYGLIKRLLAERRGSGVRLVVNRAQNEQQALDVFQRVNRSCRRFLGFEIEFAGHVDQESADDACISRIAARLGDARQLTDISQRRAA